MKSFVWDSFFVTGLASVDEQHQYLVEVINRFGTVLTRGDAVSSDDIEQVFSEVTSYADYHFREEESLMAKSRVDPRHIALQHDQHAHFLAEVIRLHTDTSVDRDGNGLSLLKFLIYWLTYHILGTDQFLAKQIARIEAGATPEEAYLAPSHDHDAATATLLAALDGLFTEVSARNRALAELNQKLEARVAERTVALSEANQRLESLAMTDVLTGLPNRRHAMTSLEQAWNDSVRRELPLACLMIDADGFKAINDTQGHEAGDLVLRELARVLRDSARTDDIACRLGGDEFLIICPLTPLEGALQLAEAVRRNVAAAHVPGAQGQSLGTVSVGVAARAPATKGLAELIKAADEGVYLAKRNGRNRIASVCSATPGEANPR